MKFEWDETKAAMNLAKHGIAFDEAKTVFNDPLQVDFYDKHHSKDESRYIIIGKSALGRLLLVSYTERNTKIRLISARKTTSSEYKNYERNSN